MRVSHWLARKLAYLSSHAIRSQLPYLILQLGNRLMLSKDKLLELFESVLKIGLSRRWLILRLMKMVKRILIVWALRKLSLMIWA